MSVDVEETLGRELRELAESLTIPAMPPLTQEPRRAPRHRPSWHGSSHWQPLLVAASVALVIAGAVAVVATARGGRDVQPAPSPSPTPSVVTVPRTAATVPHLLGPKLYVDGDRLPGDWYSVSSGKSGWVALRADNTWWWGTDAEPHRIEGTLDAPPVISPNGTYVAEIVEQDGTGLLTGFDTDPSGEGLGGLPIDLGDSRDGSAVTVRAVTDDGWVIAQGTKTSLLWLPTVVDRTETPVDLTETAPGQVVLANTPAGLVVTDGDGGEPYLAEISDQGVLTRTGAVPAHDDLLVSPGGTRLAWTPEGTTGGEVTEVASLETQTVDGGQRATLAPPDGWAFRVRSYQWEDDDLLVSTVVRDRTERLARCSAQAARCVLIGNG
jgi:hypothetical protein